MLKKIIALIMSIVILFLTFLPCRDNVHYDYLQHNGIEVVNSDCSEDISCCVDLCSVFCSCQCCQSLFCVSDKLTFTPNLESHYYYYYLFMDYTNIQLSEFKLPPKA